MAIARAELRELKPNSSEEKARATVYLAEPRRDTALDGTWSEKERNRTAVWKQQRLCRKEETKHNKRHVKKPAPFPLLSS